MADIFISYARTDRERIEALAATLEAQGHSVWWDRQILGGDDFVANIERELNAASAVIVAWSSVGSGSHWVRDEAQVAANSGKLVAISLDGSLPPMGFRQFHAIDFSHWQGQADDDALQALTRAVAMRLDGGAPATGPPGTTKALVGKPIKLDDKGPRIAVVPIKVRGNDPDLLDLADDLAGSVASGLSRFSWLNVTTQASVAEGKANGARYVLEGTLRKAGTSLRLATRLSTTGTERQVWGENYNRAFDPDSIFEVHDDLTDHVVAAVADPYGALMRHLSAPVLELQPEDMSPYEALIRSFVYRMRINRADHLITRRALELAVERAPHNANLWAARAFIHLEEYTNQFNKQVDSLDQGIRCARRAAEIDPQSAYVQYALFDTCYFGRDLSAARAAGRRALELNPRDTDAIAFIGILTGYSGDWEQGLKLVNRAIELNPHGPGWYWFGSCSYYYWHGDFERSLEHAKRVDMPDYQGYYLFLALAYVGLGQLDEARACIERWKAVWPGSMEDFRLNNKRWFYAQPEYLQRLEDDLRTAGMDSL
ncbi:MAG: TIR domain-containing protein [Lysobacterales bacterium]